MEWIDRPSSAGSRFPVTIEYFAALPAQCRAPARISPATREAIHDLFDGMRYRMHWVSGNALLVGDPVRRGDLGSSHRRDNRRDMFCVPD